MNMSKRNSVWFLILALLVLAGCDKGRDLWLLGSGAESPDSSKPKPKPKPGSDADADAEHQRLQSLQLVRYIDSQGKEFFMPASALPGVLGDYCDFHNLCPGAAQSDCAGAACIQRSMLCTIRFLQSAALIRAEPLTLPRAFRLKDEPANGNLDDLSNYDEIFEEVKVPPQSPGARVGLLRLALDLNKQSVNALAIPASICTDQDQLHLSAAADVPGQSGVRAGGLWGEVTVEAFELLREISEDTVDAILGAADAQRSVSPTTAQGAARSSAGEELSRAEAAHLLIGGSPGLLGDTTTAFCSSPELSGSAQGALRVLRRAAPDPNDIGNDAIDIGTLLNAGPGSFPRGSVRVRLEALDGEPITSVEDKVGLSREDFLQARSYLAQELRTFARDDSVTFVPEALAAIPSTVFFYAATGHAPVPPPPEYFAALARHWFFEGPTYIPFGANETEARTLLAADLSATMSNALGHVREATGLGSARQLFANIDSTGETQRQFQAPLNLLTARDGRAGQLGWFSSGSNTTAFFADGYDAEDKLRVVRGLSGLLCATTGQVEGQPCTATTLNSSSHTVATLLDADFPAGSGGANVGVGYSSSANGIGEVDWEDPTPLFLVKPKNPEHEVPGGYETLGGFSMRALPRPGNYRFALFPELDRKAGAILRPSEKWCTRSAVECDGAFFDERLPLENELSEDFDDVESSWRHYLALAEQASAEAHALGAEYLQNGLEVDRQLESTQIRDVQDRQRYLDRVDGEMETIQDICGTAMDTQEIQGLLGLIGPGSLGPTNGTFCTEADGERADSCCLGGAGMLCPYTCRTGLCIANECGSAGSDEGCPYPYQCIANRCAISLIRVQDEQTHTEGLSRLRECIGDGTVLDYVALGGKPLCLWDGGAAAPTSICGGANELFACPVPALQNADGSFSCDDVPRPMGVETLKLVTTTLGLNNAQSLITTTDPCHYIRTMRDRGCEPEERGIRGCPEPHLARDLYDYFIRAFVPEFLGPEHLLLAKSIGWRVEAPNATGNASSILVDGRPRWSTKAGSLAWPCADFRPLDQNHPPLECPNEFAGLFCSKLEAGCPQDTPSQRFGTTSMNLRMFSAIMALKGLTAGDFDKIEVPVRLPPEALASLGSPLFTRDAGAYIEQGFSNGTLRFYDDPTSSTPAPQFWQTNGPDGFEVPAQDGDIVFRQKLSPVSYQFRGLIPAVLPSLFRQGVGYPTMWDWADDFDVTRPLPGNISADDPFQMDTPYLTPRQIYTEENIVDAVELLCEVTRTEASVNCPQFNLAQLTANNDFDALKEYAACRVNGFIRAVGAMVLPRVPRRAVEGVASFSVAGGFPVVGGQMGAQMLRLRAALTRYGEFATTMAENGSQMVDLADDMSAAVRAVGVQTDSDQAAIDIARAQGLQATLRSAQNAVRMDQIEFQQEAAKMKANSECIKAAAEAGASLITSLGTGAITFGPECDAAWQEAQSTAGNLSYEMRIAEIEGQITQLQEAISSDETLRAQNQALLNQIAAAREMIGLRAQFRGVVHSMGGLVREAQASLDEIRASLAEIENLRLRVQRSLSRSVQFETTQAAVTENIDAVLNAKLNVSKKRYLQAHKNAIRLSFLAKRAIEQRLGVHLSELRADMPLVEAPSSWEADVCAAEGIDYQAIRATAAENGTTPAVPVDFSGAFIGDYVNKLKNVVESYRLQYDFHEGTDEVVASLRDDVLNVRAPCSRLSSNLLRHSGELDHLVASAGTGWQIDGCETTEEEGSPSTCLDIVRAADRVVPGAPGFAVAWGADSVAETRLVQKVTLTRGRYRASWFSPLIGMSAVPEVDVGLYGQDGAPIAPVSYDDAAFDEADLWTRPGISGQWPRHYRLFDVSVQQDGVLAIQRSSSTTETGGVGGLMLEMIPDDEEEANPRFLPPSPFVATGDTLETTVRDCQDTTGEVFRLSQWRHQCAKLCSDGFSGNCLDSSLADRCYWETIFSLDQRELEGGRIFAQSGFARGNFNYRIEDVAVNFVGTELRDCSGSALPSTCNAAGFVTYSLKHLGPLFVRNHTGGDFPIKLFTGNIEHARGLGIERYLTNPISSTDRELLTPYARKEFNGRPLDGNFVLRVWDEGDVNFDAIQDVQLYIKYRYWTRFE
jgi:hypothetical protein